MTCPQVPQKRAFSASALPHVGQLGIGNLFVLRHWVMVCFRWIALVLTAAVGACTGDDTPAKHHMDATTDSQSEAEASTEAGAARGKVLVVHASPNFPTVRWCFAVGTKSDGSDAVPLDATPLPDTGQPFAGLVRGGGFVLPDIGDLSGVVVPYAIAADKITTIVRPTTCAAVLSPDAGLVPGGDYERLGAIPAATFAPGKTVLLALSGCLPLPFDPTASAARCGNDFNPLSGNLVARTFEVDRSAVNGQLGAQLAHLSSPLSGELSMEGVAVSLTNAPDAGTVFVTPVAPSVKYGELAPNPAAHALLPSPTQSAISLGVLNPDGGATPLGVYVFSFPDVLKATTGDTSGADQYFKNGAGYTFVLTGDPDAGEAGSSLQVIALPSDPVVPKYP